MNKFLIMDRKRRVGRLCECQHFNGPNGRRPAASQSEQKTPEQEPAPVDIQTANEVDARNAELKANLHLTAGSGKELGRLADRIHDYGVGR